MRRFLLGMTYFGSVGKWRLLAVCRRMVCSVLAALATSGEPLVVSLQHPSISPYLVSNLGVSSCVWRCRSASLAALWSGARVSRLKRELVCKHLNVVRNVHHRALYMRHVS